LRRRSSVQLAHLSSTEARYVRYATAQAIRQAAGSVPGGWERWAAEILEPKVDWRRELATAIRVGISQRAGCVDFSYRRPSRRGHAVQGVVLPAMCHPVPRVAIVIDTSGSISAEMLGSALGEVKGILRAVGCQDGVDLLSVDYEVQGRSRVTRAEKVQLRGGGGTNMGAGLEAAAELRSKPDVCIVVTDGWTPWPESPVPGRRTIALLLCSGSTAPPTPPSWVRPVRPAN
jgi:predicted metal-dependent peptidase